MLKSLLDILFPPVCPLCEERLSADTPGFCRPCTSGFELERIKGPVCGVCGSPFRSTTGEDHPCGACLIERRPFKKALSAFMYNGTVLEAVHEFKYNDRVTLAPPLARLLIELAGSLKARPDIVIPVPLHKKRLKMRGFNQSLLISRLIARALHARLDYSTLKKTVETAPQVGLDRDSRRENVKGAFSVTDKTGLKGRRVLLVDDVYTTGSTIGECAKALKKTGAEVYALTLARA